MALDAEKLKRRLSPRHVEYFDEINSTNAKLHEEINNGTANRGDVIAAGRQSAGRGRRGKSFSSPDGGIYFSFAANNTDSTLVTVDAGIAVAATLEKFGYSPKIKWVNDVLICGKKVCGILAEAVGDTSLRVVGIGINLHADAIPDELRSTASALDECAVPLPQAEVIIAEILEEFDRLESLPKYELIARYKKYLAFIGNEIEVRQTGEVCIAEDVTEDGELIVKRKSGERLILNSGEISITI